MVYAKAVGGLVVLALGAWLFLGIVFGDGDTSTTERLEVAACEDLDNPDVSMFQVISEVVDSYSDRDNPQLSAAVFLDETIREECPEHLDLWESNILYEDWIAE